LVTALEAGAEADVVELAEPDSPPLAVFDSVLAPDSVLASALASLFLSVAADSAAELLLLLFDA
jgi:hypothetical protein